jgi:hypothetical protein
MARKIYIKQTEYTIIDSVYDHGDEPHFIHDQPLEDPLMIEEKKPHWAWKWTKVCLILIVILWIVGSLKAHAQPIPGARYNGQGQPPVCAYEDLVCRAEVRRQWGYDGFGDETGPASAYDTSRCQWLAPRTLSCSYFDSSGRYAPRGTICQFIGSMVNCN